MTKRLPIKKSNKYGYYGAVVNDLFIDGAQGEPSVLYDNLDHNEQIAWEKFATQKNLDAVEFYNEKGTQIKLSRLQTFILMKLQEKYNKEIENNYDMKKGNWMKSGPEPENIGVVHITAVGLAKEIFNYKSGKHVREIRDAIKKLNTESGYLRYYVRDNNNKFVTRIERCSLIISYGVDIYDSRIREYNWVRLHPVFFSVLRKRYIRCLDHTALMSQYFNYDLPPMSAMILFKYLSKFGNKDTVQIYASNLMSKICRREFMKRQIKQCRDIVKIACEACKHVGIINGYKDNIIGETGEMKYVFVMNPQFFKSTKTKKDESVS